MAKNTKYITRKYRDDHPDMIAMRKYEAEIASLEEKQEAAFKAHDWSMRNFYGAQLLAKRGNLKLLKEKMSKRFNRAICD